jgi:hypothetical protein
MNNETNQPHISNDTADRVADDTYDRGIVPAETAARKEREGADFKHHQTEAGQQQAENDDQTAADSVHTADGYTVDREGLINNYAIEPEMYVNEPGDLREEADAERAERQQERQEMKQDSDGKLTMDGDRRGRGPGLV